MATVEKSLKSQEKFYVLGSDGKTWESVHLEEISSHEEPLVFIHQ